MNTLDDFFGSNKIKLQEVILKEPKTERECECGSKDFIPYLEGDDGTVFYWCAKCNRKSHYTKKKEKIKGGKK